MTEELTNDQRANSIWNKIRRVFSKSARKETNNESRYRARKTIGSGAFSVVYEVVHTETNKLYACKVIDKKRLVCFLGHRIHKAIDGLRNEVKLGLKLGHPNIIKLKDAFETPLYVALVMEEMHGGDLNRYIMGRDLIREEDVREMIRQVTSALQFLHSVGVVHRDLKPENIMLTKALNAHERRPMIKLIDFGYSRFLARDSTTTSFVGTSMYAAPEVHLSKGYDHKVDMWSLGVLSHVLLSDQYPFSTYMVPVKKALTGESVEPSFASAHWRKLSSYASEFVSVLLSVDPRSRLSSAEALKSPWFTNCFRRRGGSDGVGGF